MKIRLLIELRNLLPINQIQLFFKKYLLIVLFFNVCFSLAAGDDPCSPTTIANDMMDFLVFDNSGSTSSGIPDPICGNYTGNDFWFSVTAPSSGVLFIATREGSMTDAAMALYELPCTNPTEIICIPNDLCGNTEMPIYTFDNLIPGQDYLLRIWPENGTPNGDFSIFANENPIIVPDFILNGNATYINDECIRLTANTTGQVGCIWFPELIDFTQGFTHSMTMNFGNNNSGADGICLAYQSLGTWFCGGSGENIGAGGMSNSFIVEFDTYQNGSQNDPAQDHTGIGINGVLNHAASPFPAMVLNPTNVENGNDYVVDFVWDPSMNYFEVYFDGTLYNSGVYDIINNCFNGNNMAYWGYTSSTGGAFNTQTVCPGVETFEHGELTVQEITICDDETFFAGGALQNTSGVYYDQSPISNGCYQLTQTILNVLPTFYTDLGSVYICLGETFEMEGVEYTVPGMYDIVFQSIQNGCDSTVHFNLNQIGPVAVASVNDQLDCNNPSINISGIGSWPPPVINGVIYSWTGPNGFNSNDVTPIVSVAGEYQLIISQTIAGVTCLSDPASVVVTSAEEIPFADAGDTSVLDCNILNVILDGSLSDPNLEYKWVGPNGFVSLEQISSTDEAGTYTLYVTADNGCSNSSQVVVTEDYSVYEIQLEADSLSCSVTETSIQNLHFDGTGNYFWTGPDIDPEDSFDEAVIVETPGTYIVQITGENGCVAVDSIEVIRLPGDYEYALVADTLSCATTAVNLYSNPGGNFDLIAWSGPNNFIDSTANPLVDLEGLYYFEITDINGCKGIDSIELILNDTLPIINFMVDSIQCTQDGEISLSANDNYSYQWYGPGSFESEEQNIISGITGDYQLEVTGPNGCTDNYNIHLPATDDYPSYQTSFNHIDCNNTTSTINFSSTELIDQIEWTSQNGFSSNEETITTDEEAIFYLEVTGNTGCTVFDTIEIRVDTIKPSVALEADTLTCLSNSVVLETNNLSNYNSTQWTGPNNFSSDQLNPIIEEAGIYTLNLIGDNSCESLSTIEVYEAKSKPNLVPIFNHLDCNTPFSTISFSGDNNISFNWEGPDNFTSQSETEMVIQDGLYTIKATNQYGCDTTLLIDIFRDTISPSFSIDIPSLNCNNTEAILSFQSQDNIVDHAWFGPNGLIGNTAEITVDYSGDFYLTVEASNGCVRSQDFTILEDFEYPLISTQKSNDLDCINQSSTLTSDSDIPNPTISWLDSDHNVLSDESDLNVESAGYYYLEIFGQNGCTSIDSIEVLIDTISPPLSISYNDISCYENIAFINVINPDNNINYEMFSDSISISQNASFSTEEALKLQIIAQSINGCMSEENIEINIDTIAPTVNPEVTLINCFNPEATLSVIQNSDYNYNWSLNDVIQSNNSSFETSIPGDYQIFILNETNGCVNSSLVTVEEYLPLQFDFMVDPLDCNKDFGSIQLNNIEGGNPEYEYSINNGQNFTSSTLFDNLDPGTYQLLVQDEDGCQAFAEYVLEDLTPVQIELDPEITIQLGDEVNLEVVLNLLENELSFIEWSMDTDLINCSDCLNPQIVGFNDGTLQLLVVDQNDCEDIATISVRFNKIVEVYVPNVFSPHQKDGNNDYFFPFAKAQQIKQIDQLIIFDRWGEQVFQQYDFPPNESEYGWDGTFKDKALNPGVFAYFLKYTRIDGEQFQILGDVTIVD